MTLKTTAALILSAVSAAAACAGTTGPDLVLTDVEFIDIRDVGTRFDVGYEYEITNIGDVAVDFEGVSPDTQTDNIGLQTYIANSEAVDMQAFAAGGSGIFESVVLQPGETYRGVLYSNNRNTPQPTQFGDYVWLVIDLLNTHETGAAQLNNRTVVQIPVPCGPADRAAPFGQLDLADVTWFADRFLDGNEIADVTNDGLLDLSDVVAFVEGFFVGCGGIE